jgi:AhpD family alkylhydroperoxidase
VRLCNVLVRRQFGRELDSVNIVARSPGLFIPYLLTSRLARGKTALSPTVRSLAMHLVAARNGCGWCMDFGLASAMKAGESPEKLLAVLDYRTDDRFSAAERAALAYAEAITDGTGYVPDEVFDALRPHFSEREIVELTIGVAIENFFNRINGPLGIEAQGFCALPATFSAASGARPGLSRGTV